MKLLLAVLLVFAVTVATSRGLAPAQKAAEEIDLTANSVADCVEGVVSFDSPDDWMIRLDPDGLETVPIPSDLKAAPPPSGTRAINCGCGKGWEFFPIS